MIAYIFILILQVISIYCCIKYIKYIKKRSKIFFNEINYVNDSRSVDDENIENKV